MCISGNRGTFHRKEKKMFFKGAVFFLVKYVNMFCDANFTKKNDFFMQCALSRLSLAALRCLTVRWNPKTGVNVAVKWVRNSSWWVRTLCFCLQASKQQSNWGGTQCTASLPPSLFELLATSTRSRDFPSASQSGAAFTGVLTFQTPSQRRERPQKSAKCDRDSYFCVTLNLK